MGYPIIHVKSPKTTSFWEFYKIKKKNPLEFFFFTRLTLSHPSPYLPLRFSLPLVSLSVSVATTRIKVSILTIQSPSLFSPFIEDFVEATLGEFFSLCFSGFFFFFPFLVLWLLVMIATRPIQAGKDSRWRKFWKGQIL